MWPNYIISPSKIIFYNLVEFSITKITHKNLPPKTYSVFGGNLIEPKNPSGHFRKKKKNAHRHDGIPFFEISSVGFFLILNYYIFHDLLSYFHMSNEIYLECINLSWLWRFSTSQLHIFHKKFVSLFWGKIQYISTFKTHHKCLKVTPISPYHWNWSSTSTTSSFIDINPLDGVVRATLTLNEWWTCK